MTTARTTDVLLVDVQSYYDLEFGHSNMGLLYIASYLESRGYSVRLISTADYLVRPPGWLPGFLKLYNPTVIGFYVSSDNLEVVRKFTSRVKEALPDAWIVAGGPQAAAEGAELFNALPRIEAVVTGEGEYALEQICASLCRKEGNLSDVPGIILKRNGEILPGAPPKIIENLDALPFPDKKYFKRQFVFQVVSGRGCPYSCTFCFQTGYGLRHRFRSAENVLEEITGNLDALPFVGIEFIDDVFIIDPKRAMKILQGLEEYRKRTGRDFIIFCQGRVDILSKHPELIEAMARAGVNKIQLGIESGDPDTLKHYNKRITPDQVRKTVELIRDTNSMIALGGFILGGPFETEKTFRNTLELAVELVESAPGAFVANSGFLCAYPGTDIALYPEKYGLTRVEPDFRKGPSASDVQFVTKDFPDKNAIRMLKHRFDEEVNNAMARNLHRIPPSLLHLHYLWAQKYQTFSQWYSYYLSNLAVVSSYFRYLGMPGFRPLAAIPREDRGRWYPMRMAVNRGYNPDGTLPLPVSIKSITLTNPEDILIYELSSGKLTLREVAEITAGEFHPEKSPDEVLAEKVIPLMEQLEKTYHVAFFR